MSKKILAAGLILGVIAIVAVGVGMRFFIPAPVVTSTQAANLQAPNAGAQVGGFGRGQGAGGQGRGQGQGQGAAANGVEWTTLQATVTAVDNYALTVKAANGETVTVQNRPWTFALEQQFAANVGDTVSMTGFYQNGLFEVGQIQNVTTGGATVQVRDTSGRPGWAGRGNGRNGGNGGYGTYDNTPNQPAPLTQ